MKGKRPRLNVVSGPSGAGKSTFSATQEDWPEAANIDTLEKTLGSREAAFETMNEIIEQRINEREDFVIDHVVDNEAIKTWVEPAIVAGYDVWGWLLATDQPETTMTRVRQRKHEGGHGTDDEGVRALHAHALGGFGELSLVCHHSVLIDVSNTKAEISAVIEGFEYTPDTENMPAWVDELTEGLIHTGRLPRWTEEAMHRVPKTRQGMR